MVSSESSSFMVPEHLVETILVKLPVKSLVRFKLLSKNFRDLMDSSRFVAAHLQASSLVHLQKRSTVLLTVHDYPQGIRQDRMLMLSEENGHVHHKEEQLPTFASDGDGRHQSGDIHYIDLLGSQNGLICLCLHYTMYNNKKIVLWNPATRQSRILPPPPPPSLSRVCGVVDLGFAYNHDKDDYMVSGIVGMIDDDTATNRMCYQVDVFSMRHWGWETYIYRHELASNVPSGCMSSLGPSHSATLKGTIYRVVSVVLADGTCDNFVLSMDVKNILFNRIELPETKDLISLHYDGWINSSFPYFFYCTQTPPPINCTLLSDLSRSLTEWITSHPRR
ncbi:F-box/kelch-repeat protein At3g23880 [Linum perenne]